MAESLIPAAQYLRMSTDHQQYSLDTRRHMRVRENDAWFKSGVALENVSNLLEAIKVLRVAQAEAKF